MTSCWSKIFIFRDVKDFVFRPSGNDVAFGLKVEEQVQLNLKSK